MWKIKKHFEKYSTQEEIAKFLLETGLNVKDGRIYCNDVLMSPSRIARTLDVDRKTVDAAIETIEESEELSKIYRNLEATAFFGNVAPELDAGVIEIAPSSPEEPGLISSVTTILADLDVVVRQCITREIEFHEDPTLIIITDSPVPGEALKKIREIEEVESVKIS